MEIEKSVVGKYDYLVGYGLISKKPALKDDYLAGTVVAIFSSSNCLSDIAGGKSIITSRPELVDRFLAIQ